MKFLNLLLHLLDLSRGGGVLRNKYIIVKDDLAGRERERQTDRERDREREVLTLV